MPLTASGFTDGKYYLASLKCLFRNRSVKLPLKLICLFLWLVLQTLLSFFVGEVFLGEMMGVRTKLCHFPMHISNMAFLFVSTVDEAITVVL